MIVIIICSSHLLNTLLSAKLSTLEMISFALWAHPIKWVLKKGSKVPKVTSTRQGMYSKPGGPTLELNWFYNHPCHDLGKKCLPSSSFLDNVQTRMKHFIFLARPHV